MSKNEEEFDNSLNAVNEILENAVKYYFNALYCIEIDYINNKDYYEFIDFCDSYCIGSQHTMISFLNKLIDKTSFSIYELIQFVKKYPCMYKKVKEDTLSVINKIETEFTSFNEIIGTLKRHRNEFHSHLGKNLAKTNDIYNIFYENKISIKQIEDLLKFLAKSIVNIWSLFYDTYSSPYILRFMENNKDVIYEMSGVKKAFDKLKNK